MFLAGQYRDLMQARSMLEKGLLPVAGGWAEQPYHWIQALEVIGAQAAQVERERMAALRDKNNDVTLDL